MLRAGLVSQPPSIPQMWGSTWRRAKAECAGPGWRRLGREKLRCRRNPRMFVSRCRAEAKAGACGRDHDVDATTDLGSRWFSAPIVSSSRRTGSAARKEQGPPLQRSGSAASPPSGRSVCWVWGRPDCGESSRRITLVSDWIGDRVAAVTCGDSPGCVSAGGRLEKPDAVSCAVEWTRGINPEERDNPNH